MLQRALWAYPTIEAVKQGGGPMQERSLTLPELVLIAGTRVALGAGIGLLMSEKLSRDTRRGAGWALLGMGAVTTIPIVIGLLGKHPSRERKPV
jgi:hypothetical protein